MQGRHRNHSPNDGFRPGYRSRCRGRSGSSGVGFTGEPYRSPPPPRKEDILIEAGRLAAEYLAYKGCLLPSDSPSPKTDCREFKGRVRDSSLGADGRDSAFNRLRFNAGNERRRYEDEYGRNGFRGKKRYSPDWGRDNERWTSRNRGGYSGSIEEEEDDYSPRYRRDRRSRLDHMLPRSEIDRRSLSGHMLPRSEQTSDSGSENHDVAVDTGSKASSSGTRKKPPVGPEMNFGKVREGGQKVSFETADEVSGDSKKINLVEEHSEVVGGEDKCNSGLIRGFTNVSTKQRTLQKNATIDQEVTMEESNTAEAASGEDPKEGSLTDLLENGTDILKAQTNDTSSAIPTQPIEKCVNLGQKSILTPAIITEGEQMIRGEGVKKRNESSPEDEDEYCRQDNLRAEQSNTKDEMYVMEEAKVAPVAIAKEKSVKNTSFPESEPEEEKQIIPSSFKNFDLNLTSTPETTEICDDSFLNHLRSPAPRLDTGKETSMVFDFSVGSHNNGTHDYGQLPSHDKMVQVIDLEDDSHVEANRCDPSKPKDESTIHPNLGNFLSHTGHVDLPGIQDGYAPALSEFLGNDLSPCSSVSSDLHNLQARVGLHDAEGGPNDDDSIYVSLGEIPIGFMEVWDQPPPDYGKLF